jgi:hypothetical protein
MSAGLVRDGAGFEEDERGTLQDMYRTTRNKCQRDEWGMSLRLEVWDECGMRSNKF